MLYVAVSAGNQKSNPLATYQYGPIVNNGTLQPSQVFVPYDPGQPVNQPAPTPAPTAAAPAPQNVNSSQLISSQLMQQR